MLYHQNWIERLVIDKYSLLKYYMKEIDTCITREIENFKNDYSFYTMKEKKKELLLLMDEIYKHYENENKKYIIKLN